MPCSPAPHAEPHELIWGFPTSGWPLPCWVTPGAMGLQAGSGCRRGGGRLPPALGQLPPASPGHGQAGGRRQGCPLQPTHRGSLSPSCPAGWDVFRTGSTGLLHSLAPPAAAIGFGPFIVWRRGRSYSGAGRKYPGRRIHAWLFAETVSLWEGGRERGREKDAKFDIPPQEIILPSTSGWQSSVLPLLLQSLQLELVFATDYKAREGKEGILSRQKYCPRARSAAKLPLTTF